MSFFQRKLACFVNGESDFSCGFLNCVYPDMIFKVAWMLKMMMMMMMMTIVMMMTDSSQTRIWEG